MSRYVYRQLSAADLLVIFMFVFTPVLYFAGDFLLSSLGVIFVATYTAALLLITLIWFGVAAWWVWRRLFP